MILAAQPAKPQRGVGLPMQQSTKQTLLLIAKIGVVVLVVWFVSDALRDAWRQLSEQRLRLAPGWALVSGVLLLLGQLPMAWYWRRTLQSLDEPAPLGRSIAAYYLSQIGKYVPGKAAVVLIRTERLVASAGGRYGPVAAAVFYETLTLMAFGGVLSALLLANRFGDEQRTLTLLAGVLGFACLVPTMPPVASRIAKRITRRPANAPTELRLTWRLMVEGWLYSLAAWSLMAASIAFAARSVGLDPPMEADTWLLAATLPVVAGFLSLLPAGVVVRDALMLQLLSPALGEAGALATTVATRIIWIAAESLACGILVGVNTRRAS